MRVAHNPVVRLASALWPRGKHRVGIWAAVDAKPAIDARLALQPVVAPAPVGAARHLGGLERRGRRRRRRDDLLLPLLRALQGAVVELRQGPFYPQRPGAGRARDD